MPFHLPPLSRRRFLVGSAGLGAGLFLPQLGASAQADPDRWALLSDTHVAADARMVARGVPMAEHLRRTVAEVLDPSRKPAGAILNGDCAYGVGLPEDYRTLGGLLKPLSEAGVPVHVSLGNHDDRGNIRSGLPAAGGQRLLESKHVSVVETRRANWFILDSLDAVNMTPGRIGPEQQRWLAEALDARRDKPALVVCHHNPYFMEGGKNTGILDTQELFALLQPRKQVKAFLFGHTHHWEIQEREGLHLINLPPVAYTFREGDPSGWVDVRLGEQGASFELRALDPQHPGHGKVTNLKWRQE